MAKPLQLPSTALFIFYIYFIIVKNALWPSKRFSTPMIKIKLKIQDPLKLTYAHIFEALLRLLFSNFKVK